jgi:hypothetical protein
MEMKMKSRSFRLALAGLFILAASAIAGAQGVRYDNTALLDSGRPAQGIGIRVCSSGSTGTPCTPLASIFTDSALSLAITQPGLQSDAQGNYNFYAACGKYDIQLTGNGVTTRTMKDAQLGPCGPFRANVSRVIAGQGTLLTAGRFVLNAAFGTTASITSVRGTDAAFTITILSSGTGQAINPGFTLTFADGTWTNPPICTLARVDGASPQGSWFIPSPSATALIVDLNAVPVAGNNYIVNVACFGSPN